MGRRLRELREGRATDWVEHDARDLAARKERPQTTGDQKSSREWSKTVTAAERPAGL